MSVYLPAAFRGDPDDAARVIASSPLATLVSASGPEPWISHVPMRWTGEVLRGHLARANPHADVLDGARVVAVFRGPHGYVSPSYYASKAAHGAVVPTWNYAVVHVHATARLIDDPAWLANELDELTRQHEADRATPWRPSDAPDDYLTRQRAAIVGVELAPTHIEVKLKLSQNRSDADRAGVVDGLRADGHHELANWVADAARSTRGGA